MSAKLFKSKRTGEVVQVVEVAVGFSNRKMDMFRVVKADGAFSSVDRDSIRRRYVAI